MSASAGRESTAAGGTGAVEGEVDASGRWVFFAVHAVVVAALIAGAIALLVTTPADQGANIGAGLLTLPLLLLGLPWSLPQVLSVFTEVPALTGLYRALDQVGWGWLYAAIFAPAILNVVVHAALVRRAQRRRLQRAATPDAR